MTAGDSSGRRVRVRPVGAREPAVLALFDALTGELAQEGYSPEETFGYSADQLETAGVVLFGVDVDGELVGVGGIEIDRTGGGNTGELKRCYVAPAHRGTGVADAVMAALVDHASSEGVSTLLLETGDRQHAAIAFYRRHGFEVTPRFGPYVASATSVCMARQLDGTEPGDLGDRLDRRAAGRTPWVG